MLVPAIFSSQTLKTTLGEATSALTTTKITFYSVPKTLSKGIHSVPRNAILADAIKSLRHSIRIYIGVKLVT